MKRKKEKKRKKGVIKHIKSTLSLYDNLIYALLAGNSSKYCRYNPSEKGKIGVDFLASYDGDNVNFYYFVRSLPSELFLDWRDRLRSECREDVRLNFIDTVQKHTIDWESPAMKSKMRFLRQASQDTEGKDIDAYNMHAAIKDLSRQNWIEASLLYLSDADKRRGRGLIKTKTMVIVSGKRGEVFDDTVKSIEAHARHIGIKLERILFDIPDVIESFLPFSRRFKKGMEERLTTRVLTDEIFSRFNTYAQGRLGSEGLYFGTDIYSNFPVRKVVKPKNVSAENILISAETEGGKSSYVKMLVLQMLAQGFNGTIMDIEGKEYSYIGNFMSHKSKVTSINMGEGQGQYYFDPVEISEPIGVDDLDKEAKNLAVDFTTAYFKVLLGQAYLNNIWLDTVINDAVTEVYRDHGVTEDMSTWVRSKGLTLHDVYEYMKSYERGRDDEEEYVSALKQAVAITRKYFEKDGTRSSVFRDRIRSKDIEDSDLLICSFGMAGKSQSSVDDIQLAIMQLGAAVVSHRRSLYSSAKGKYNFKVWEEFQRWGKFPDSDKTLGVALTGGRKNGDINLIITNKLSELLKDDLFGVFDNLTSFLVGAIGDEKVRQEFCDRVSKPLMKKELDLISTAHKPEDNGTQNESIYTYAFLCGLDRSKYAIVKMLLPKDILDSLLFNTGVKLEKKE